MNQSKVVKSVNKQASKVYMMQGSGVSATPVNESVHII
jgi:hypothetical protein